MALPRGPRIVLGIDYGTTFTGLAWAQQRDGTSRTSTGGVQVFQNWPGADSNSGSGRSDAGANGESSGDGVYNRRPKVPSQISYSATNEGNNQWGFSIDKGSHVLQWTKLELIPASPIKELKVLRNLLEGGRLLQNLDDVDNEVPTHLTKTAGEVIEDFISRVVKQWDRYMKQHARKALEETPLDIVITHPASWGYDAINATVGAVRRACHSGIFPLVRDFYIVSEPEACALHTVQDMLKKKHDSLYQRECFVLVDAGGGTVDLAAYRIDSITPLQMTMIGKAEGAECGATSIEKTFLEALEPKLVKFQGPAARAQKQNVRLVSQDVSTGGHVVFEPLAKLLNDRFEAIKFEFDNLDEGFVQLPSNFKDREDREWKLDVADDEDETIQDGRIAIERDDLEAIFENSMTGTMKLIRRQILAVENERRNGTKLVVSNILLSGGYAGNPYLFKKIQQYARKHHAGTSVQRADDCWTAVVQGAVLKAMGIGTGVATNVKFASRDYGVCLTESFDRLKHAGEEGYIDPLQNKTMVRDQISWLIKRGDMILPDSPTRRTQNIQASVSNSDYRRGVNVIVAFVAASMPETPSSLSELKHGMYEKVDLVVNLKTIPQEQLQKQKKASGWGTYLTANLLAEIEVFNDVKYTIKRNGMVVKTQSTSL